MYEAWCSLDGWPENPADVGAILEAETAARRAVGYAFGNFQGDVVEQVDVFCVVDYEGVLWLETQCDEVKGVFVRPLRGVFEVCVVADEVFFVVGYLEVEARFEFLLHMKREYPGNKVPDVDGSAGSSACVEDKFGAFIVQIKNCIQITVAEENLPLQLEVKFVGVFFHTFEKFRCEGLGAEFAD